MSAEPVSGLGPMITVNTTQTVNDSKGWMVVYGGVTQPELVTWGALSLFERRFAQSMLDPESRASWFEVARNVRRIQSGWPCGTRLYEFALTVKYWFWFDAPPWLIGAALALRWPR